MAGSSRGQQTREEILQAGARLFALHGYHHTSMNEILQAVSLSKGAFYHHFKSKKEFVAAIVTKMQEDYEQVLSSVSEIDMDQRFAALLDRLVELNESGQWYNCLLLTRLVQEIPQQEGELSQQISQIIEWLIDSWRELITAAQSTGTVNPELNPSALAELIVSMWFGAIPCRELEGEVIHLSQLAEQIKKMILIPSESGK